MAKKKRLLMLPHLLKKIAPSIGASVLLEPNWERAGQITFKSGKRSYFRYNILNLNPMGSSEISKDKDYAHYFMKSLGYSVVPKSKTFFTQEWATIVGTPNRNIDGAYAYACKIGFPVVVKPNSGSQGSGVAVVSNKREFYKAVRNVFTLDRIVLVQEQVRGKDYRLVVLDKKVVSAYERVPLNVTGNGKSTIQQLLRAKQKSFKIIERDTFIDLGDSRIRLKLKAQKRTYDSVLAKGETVYLLDNANLSTGGDSLDVSEAVHSGFKKLAIQLTADMGLRLCGVDFMIAGDITKPPKDYWILEINSAPGLDHYIKLGKAQEKIVEDLYREVFKHLE